jgi:hypothetical protein
MREAPAYIRLAAAVLLALLLALRSLAPAGFMPAFENGAVTIVICPDAAPVAAHHHHRSGDHRSGDHQGRHQPCPYAAASALGALGPEWPPLLPAIFFAVALLLGRTFLFVERHSRRERPPLRGPPILI